MIAAVSGQLGSIAWIPFVNPLPPLPHAQLWLLLPLAFCVAAVYRATRAFGTKGLLLRVVRTWITIMAGMVVIAVALWGAHELVLNMS